MVHPKEWGPYLHWWVSQEDMNTQEGADYVETRLAVMLEEAGLDPETEISDWIFYRLAMMVWSENGGWSMER